jgi:hypothetical protein
MSELCKRLQNVNEAGVYRLNCSMQDLRESADDCGFVLFEANLADLQGKGQVLAEMACVIAAPGWFGHNWDALADALADLSWRKAPGYVLVLHGIVSGDEILNDILDMTVSSWKLQNKPFWVFFA